MSDVTVMPETAAEAVANGVRWLNENFDGWQDRINPETLDMGDGFSCICGQVFKDKLAFSGYMYAFSNLFAEANSWIEVSFELSDGERAGVVSEYLGFEKSDNISYRQLKEEWLQYLNNR